MWLPVVVWLSFETKTFSQKTFCVVNQLVTLLTRAFVASVVGNPEASKLWFEWTFRAFLSRRHNGEIFPRSAFDVSSLYRFSFVARLMKKRFAFRPEPSIIRRKTSPFAPAPSQHLHDKWLAPASLPHLLLYSRLLRMINSLEKAENSSSCTWRALECQKFIRARAEWESGETF